MAELDPNDIEIGARVRQVQKYERGANRISASRLIKIAQALQIAPASFLRTSDDTDEALPTDLLHTRQIPEPFS